MGYKTILTVLTDADRQHKQPDSAIAMTRREDAHLEVFCMGVDHTQSGYYYAGASAYVFKDPSTRPWRQCGALEKVRERLHAEDIRWSVDSAVAQVGGMSTLVGMRARYSRSGGAEPNPYGENATVDAEAVTEAALFGRSPGPDRARRAGRNLSASAS